MWRDEAYLVDILMAAKRAKSHIKGSTLKKFKKSELRQDAVIRNLEMIGEAARLVSSQIKENHPKIPWGEMIGMRNRLIHEYFEIDLEKVWGTVQKDIPKLIAQIEPLVRSKEI